MLTVFEVKKVIPVYNCSLVGSHFIEIQKG
jgi:hypothetical protein